MSTRRPSVTSSKRSVSPLEDEQQHATRRTPKKDDYDALDRLSPAYFSSVQPKVGGGGVKLIPAQYPRAQTSSSSSSSTKRLTKSKPSKADLPYTLKRSLRV